MAFEATRRGFVRLLALTPLAGKVAADETIGKLSASKVDGLSHYGMVGKPVASVSNPALECASEQYNPHTTLAAHVKTFGIPAWQDENFREQAYNVGSLDPDIACKRSWSMSVKIMTQRQRNYDRLVASISTAARRSVGKRALEKLLGGYINWY